MPYHLLRKARGLPTAALVLSIMVFGSGWTPSYGDSAQASRLLKDARGLAVQLGRDANQMASFQTLTNWKSHAEQLNLIGDHINKVGKILADLHQARDGADPWQKDAIDKITPLVQELASNTKSIIDNLNGDKRTWRPEYNAYLKSNAERANDLSKLIGDYLDYEGAKARTQGLSEKAGFSGP
jgi:phage-related tail protein